jgi:hypothetical protein
MPRSRVAAARLEALVGFCSVPRWQEGIIVPFRFHSGSLTTLASRSWMFPVKFDNNGEMEKK